MSQGLFKHIIIIGARRGGTTCFWETFRKDKRFTCYDEPFRLDLRWHVVNKIDNKEKTATEYLEIPDLINQHWSAIQLYDEGISNFVGNQVVYLKELFKTGKNICVDFVRCHCKIQTLKEIFPDALIVHLIRDPRGFVTSHLKPHGQWMYDYLENDMFHCKDQFDFWRMSEMAHVMGLKGYAHEQLFNIWKYFTEAASRQEPHLVVRYEDFALEPEGIITELYKQIDLDYEPMDFSNIFKPKQPYKPRDIEWRKTADRCGVDRRCFHEYLERIV